jgi:hypothetical protein
MATCENQLWNFVSEIEPTQAQKEGAQRSHNYLRDILCTGQMESRILHHYLSGSYSRDTAIRPLDDVDIIFVIDKNQWTPHFIGKITAPSPAKVLESFASAIRYRYPVSSVFGQRRSVRLELSHLDIDVVPAILDNTNSDFIWIPDRDSGDWIKSSPKRHSVNATAVNQKQGGRFKPLVKLLKYWNGNLPSTANFKSFAIETIAVRLFQNVGFQSLEEGLLFFFDFIANFRSKSLTYRWNNGTYGMSLAWFSTSVPDAADTGTNVIANVDYDRINKFIEHAVRSRDRMLDAQKSLSVETALSHIAKAIRTSI